ncbi:MAG TPA: DNA (cytosine-5-)-methyltransferase, partial [Parafilimonas sp.]|nr:DNA (cytosine-5-)-methyltransferase [Parafilimonas sp.]
MHELGAQCVFACEIDKFARKTYEANFKAIAPVLFENGNFAEDITKVDASQIPGFDILCAGFPCQAFSVAGMRKGLEDPRGRMIFEIIRILKAKQPKAFILENVRGLLSHDRGKTFIKIIRLLR